MTCLSFITSLKILSPNIVVLEIRASIQEFEGSSNNCERFLIRKVGFTSQDGGNVQSGPHHRQWPGFPWCFFAVCYAWDTRQLSLTARLRAHIFLTFMGFDLRCTHSRVVSSQTPPSLFHWSQQSQEGNV